MNKILFLFLVFFACSIPVIGQYNLIGINPLSSTISPGEVYQAELSLKNPITELKKQDIKLYSSSQMQQPISPFLLELEKNKYFVYFEIPKSTLEGEYTLKIEEQSFLVNNILIKEEGIAGITTKISEPSVSFNPAVIQLLKDKSGSFIISATSHDVSTELYFIVPQYITHTYTVQQYLNKNTQRNFVFNYNTMNATPSQIEFTYGNKKFIIPIFIKDYSPQESEENKSQSNVTTQNNAIKFFVEENKLSKMIDSAETIEGNLKMSNLLNSPILGLEITLESALDGVIDIQPSFIEKVNPLANFTVLITINPNKKLSKGIYSGKLLVSNKEIFNSLNIEIEVTEKVQDVIHSDISNDNIKETLETPEDKQDVVEQIIPWNISEGYEQQSKAASKPLIALITILLIVAILVFILSQKKTTKKKTFKELMEESKR